MQTNSKKPYANIIHKYKEEDYFVQNVILLKYMPNHSEAIAGNKSYVVTGLQFLESDDDKNKEKIQNLVDKCNNDIVKNTTCFSWQIFYVLKELLQTLTVGTLKFNYFRGQSNSKAFLPGALRYEETADYINDFESLYRKLSYEYPDIIDYVSINDKSSIVERESNLSVLQHYGLKTALLDITKNPYIAMLFMLKDNIKEYREPTLYLFKINDNESNDVTLFSEVRKTHINERIIAQKGAFLNFEKVLYNKVNNKIPYIKIILHFDTFNYLKLLIHENNNNERLNSKIIDDSNFIQTNIKFLKDEDSNKLYCLQNINKELETKLKEYYYTKEDMFPDFENRIRYLSNKYSDVYPKTKKLNIDDEDE